MHEYLTVAPGVNLSRLLGGKRLTKKFVRDAMRDHPEWDWRILSVGHGTYVNGEDAIRYNLTLDVSVDGSHLAFIDFKAVERKPEPEAPGPNTVGAMLNIQPEDTRTVGERIGYIAVVS